MKGSFELKVEFPVKPVIIFNAWLNSEEHTNMTGGEAVCSNAIGDQFSAWDGYIFGKNLSIKVDTEIIQSWRTMEFEEKDEDSKITLRFEANGGGCLLTLLHENIPNGQPDYEKGWVDFYFDPMRDYFKDL